MDKQLRTCAALMAACSIFGFESQAKAGPPPPPVVDSAEIVERPQVSLSFDTGVLTPDLADRLEDQLRDAVLPKLAQAGLRPVDANTVGARVMRVRVLSFDVDKRDYIVSVEMAGEIAQVAVPRVECIPCSEQRVAEKVAEVTPDLIDAYDRKLELLIPDDEPEPVEQAPPRPLRPLGYVGAALLGVGVTGIAMGAYWFGHGAEVTLSDGRTDSWPEYTRAGGAALGLGVAITAVGSTLLALDLERRRHQSKGSRLGLRLSPNYLGVQFNQHF